MGRLIEWTSPRFFEWKDDDLFIGVVDVYDYFDFRYPLLTVYLPPKPIEPKPMQLYIPPTGYAVVNEDDTGIVGYTDNLVGVQGMKIVPAWEARVLSEQITAMLLRQGGNVYAYRRFDL